MNVCLGELGFRYTGVDLTRKRPSISKLLELLSTLRYFSYETGIDETCFTGAMKILDAHAPISRTWFAGSFLFFFLFSHIRLLLLSWRVAFAGWLFAWSYFPYDDCAVFSLHGATQVSYSGRLEHCFGVPVDTLVLALLCVCVAFTLPLLVPLACEWALSFISCTSPRWLCLQA